MEGFTHAGMGHLGSLDLETPKHDSCHASLSISHPCLSPWLLVACATLLHLFTVKNVHSATSCGKLCLALSLSLASLSEVYNLEICVTDGRLHQGNQRKQQYTHLGLTGEASLELKFLNNHKLKELRMLGASQSLRILQP